MWERTVKQFCFVDRVVMSRETFESLPTVEGKPQATRSHRICKALIERDGRTHWHAVEQQTAFGQPSYYARPIVVRVYAAEAD